MVILVLSLDDNFASIVQKSHDSVDFSSSPDSEKHSFVQDETVVGVYRRAIFWTAIAG